MTKDIPIKDIKIDAGTQNRPIDEDVVLRYKALIEAGNDFVKDDPIDIVFDGHSYILWNGFHRYHAYRKLGKNDIPANVETGTQRDALYFSFSANKKHGFPRQLGTVKTMVLKKVFPDKEWGAMTDQALADWIGVTRQHISKCREKYDSSKNTGQGNPQKGTGSHSGQDESPSDSKPKSEDSSSGNSQADDQNEENPVLDSLGKPVPEHLKEIFRRVPEIKEHVKKVNQIFKVIKEAVANNDPLYKFCKLDSLKADVGNLRRNLRFTIPFNVCKFCGGDVNNADCRACDGCGYQNEQSYLATPEEMK